MLSIVVTMIQFIPKPEKNAALMAGFIVISSFFKRKFN